MSANFCDSSQHSTSLVLMSEISNIIPTIPLTMVNQTQTDVDCGYGQEHNRLALHGQQHTLQIYTTRRRFSNKTNYSNIMSATLDMKSAAYLLVRLASCAVWPQLTWNPKALALSAASVLY